MFNKVKQYIKKNIILSIGIILCLGIMSTYAYTKIMPRWFSQSDTYNVVKETFLTNKGYSNELSKHVAPQVFKRTNIYSGYGDLNTKKTYKVDFSLKENSRIRVAGIVYVKMTYSVKIMDLQGNVLGGSEHVPITFTIKYIKGEWYITEKEEYA
ncbi:hypothetical protein KTC96_07105 [Clostridium estertheticum]|uniref:hypothetical protein n=1 Tax=Clostridium estertheticum TaxID=238834 RepID=UPI001C7D4470|nr:hypothetical protein [Clostridium estertheticum]MBX4260915.1 hypothetical protein [Clostridium estertheticum]WLC72767.1 hypothetical protein KTC96_07105 [Clostridium estertheticum]